MLIKKGKKIIYSFKENETWYGVDLDGTLSYFSSIIFPNIGQPIPLILDKVKFLLSINIRVKIFTARASEKKEIIKIRKYLKEIGLPQNLEITNVKDYLCVQIWDDKARRVIFNTGYFSDSDVSNDLQELKREFIQNSKLDNN